MSGAPTMADFERGYHGHGSGLVITNDGTGRFNARPMSPTELAARAPAWTIAADPFLTRPTAFAYIRLWEVIAQAITAALERDAAEHDRRVSELLAANNREVERRRAAESELLQWKDDAICAIGGGTEAHD